METQEREIITVAIQLFGKYGIRSVTMDDVAREMAISKKTIYKFFRNKADLIEKCVFTIFYYIRESMEEIHKNTQNAIDELFEIDCVVGRILQDHDPSINFQLQKYYPQVSKKLIENREKLVGGMIMENIKNGQEAGLYRTDLDNELIAFLYCTKLETMPEEKHEFFQQLGFKKIMKQALIYHIRAIATTEGLQYLEHKLNSKINK